MHTPAKTYRDFAEALRGLVFTGASADTGRVIHLYGTSDYLLLKAKNTVMDRWQSLFGAGSALQHNADELTREKLSVALTQKSLFEPAQLHVVRGLDKRADLLEIFGVTSLSNLKNWIVTSHHGGQIPAKIVTAFDRLGPTVVPCFAPMRHELPGFGKALARRFGLALSEDAATLLVDLVGENLFKLENEVQKLSLIFADGSNRTIGSADIRMHCGLLREDMVFKLEELLLGGKVAEGQWFVNDLLRRGENAGAILGFIAHHCRKALRVRLLIQGGENPRSVASTLKLPIPVVNNYNNYVTRGSGPIRILRVLRVCHNADIAIKTSRLDESVALSRVLATLSD